MWQQIKETFSWIEGFLALSGILWFYSRRTQKQDLDSETLLKRVEALEKAVNSFAYIEMKVTQLEHNVNSLANNLNNLNAQVSMQSRDQIERDAKLNNKINVVLFGLQTIFLKEGMDLNKYKDIMSVED